MHDRKNGRKRSKDGRKRSEDYNRKRKKQKNCGCGNSARNNMPGICSSEVKRCWKNRHEQHRSECASNEWRGNTVSEFAENECCLLYTSPSPRD